MELRLKECERLGINRIFCQNGVEGVNGMEIIPLRNVKELHEYLAK